MVPRILALLALLIAAQPVLAAPSSYRLDPGGSEVAFTYTLSGQDGTGTMPILRADLVLDFDNAAASRAEVELDATGVQTSVGPITDALKGETILDAARFPRIVFRSSSVTARLGGATVTGDVTIRGITRPLTLSADIFRPQGSAPGDRSHLTVRLTGAIDRHDFGASGYRDLVADMVQLRILARIVQTP
ncbi:MAG: YceI family protein [Rhodobacteraceae bacterium]|nr:YceI family protein [Paracoccaceae bacterium]